MGQVNLSHYFLRGNMAILTVQNISKSFDLKEILQSITFNVEKNDKIGLIGINGSGKTTLFQNYLRCYWS